MNKSKFEGYKLTLVVLREDKKLCVNCMYGQMYKDCPRVELLESQSLIPLLFSSEQDKKYVRETYCDSVKLVFRCYSLNYLFKVLQFTLYQFFKENKPIQVD